VTETLRWGEYCPSTQRAVQNLQTQRGLNPSGVCDVHTWAVLVEASWRLGDRYLTLIAPNMRGDDVAEVQTHLGRLGFDCGRVDGIYGPATAEAVTDFQRNCGLIADGVCGPDTISALAVLARQSGTGPGVAALRELDSLTKVDRGLVDLRVVIGQYGGLSSLVRQVTHGLRIRGAVVTPLDETDPSSQAFAANQFGANVYLGFEARSGGPSTITYYQVPQFESVGGRTLARRLEAAFRMHLPDLDYEVNGRALPILRETQMPAVLCSLGPLAKLRDQIPRLASASLVGLGSWARDPMESTDSAT
jgi:N-acetylmuramoyl-L-alanine amidase